MKKVKAAESRKKADSQREKGRRLPSCSGAQSDEMDEILRISGGPTLKFFSPVHILMVNIFLINVGRYTYSASSKFV